MRDFHMPKIRKAHFLRGRTLVFRNVCLDDSQFIYSLRTNRGRARYLSPTSTSISDHEAWLHAYQSTTDQAYFVIEHRGIAVGTVRLYDARGDSFCWGSWILCENAASHIAVESALMVYAYALDHLYFNESHFDVRRDNERVWSFHERFGAVRLRENNEDYFYSVSGASIAKSRARYRKFLDGGVEVVAL